jgi:hypothetical protein
LSKRRSRHRSRRQHAYQRPKDRAGLKFTGSHHCPECGKWCYETRADTEKAARRRHQGTPMRYYQCGGWWHCTSMDAAGTEGIRARDAVTDDRGCYAGPPEEVALGMGRKDEPKPDPGPKIKYRCNACGWEYDTAADALACGCQRRGEV